MFSDKYSLTNSEPFSLVYSSNSNTSGCKNVLLIDNAVIDASLFASSVNDDTFPIIYASTSTKTELLALLKTTFTTIDRIGLVFTSNLETIKPFLDCKPFFTKDEAAVSPYSENVEFIIAVLKEFNVKNIDYLACNTLNYPDWVNYYAILTQETNNGLVIGASNDETGNIKYGGDWVMENTSENIELIYFTKSIEYYTYLLDFNSSFGGAYHFIGIKNDGTLWGVGWNNFGQLGLVDQTNRSILTPINISMLTGKTPKSVFCQQQSTIVLMTDGTIWGTGIHDFGQLGITDEGIYFLDTITSLSQMVNTMLDGRTPQSIGYSGGHTIVLMDDGTIWGTGDNTYGQLGLGIGNTDTQYVLTQMDTTMLQSAGKTPQFIHCNWASTVVLMTDGTIWGTGLNTYGQLGLGNTTNQPVLTQMNTTMLQSVGKTPQYISGNVYTTIVLMTDGTIWGTGRGQFGQLGLGISTSKTVLTQMNTTVIGGRTPKSISSNGYATIVLMTDGTIWGTGYNNFSVLGIGNTDIKFVLTQMNTIVIGGRTPKSIFCGAEATYVLMTDGTIWGTGRNSAGELGIAEGDTTQRNVLTQMGPNNNDFAALPFEEYVSPPTLSGFSITTKTFGDSPFTITPPTSNSDGEFTYTSANTAVATISGTTVTIVGAGTSVITATQAATATYTTGTITASFQVDAAFPTPTLSGFSIATKTFGDSPFGDSPFTITPPTTNSDGEFTYTSANTAVATISGTTVTIVGAGTSVITATQAATATYTTGTITTSFQVNKATVCLTNQSIVNVIASNGNKYVFNNSSSYDSNIVYGLGIGTYVFKNIGSAHPMALLNNGLTNSITYSGDNNTKLTQLIDGISYDFYYGDITIQVNGNFGTISVYCYYHGYMGGQDLLKYSDSCIPPLPLDASVINDIVQQVPTVDTSLPAIVVDAPDSLLTVGSETVKSQKRTTFLENLFIDNVGLASAAGKITMTTEKLLGASSVITKDTMVIVKESNTDVIYDILQLAADEAIYVFMSNGEYSLFNTSNGILKITKISEILYNIYENYVDSNSPLTKTMSVGESSNIGTFVYVLGGVSGQLNQAPAPAPRPPHIYSMRSIYTNNAQVYYKPHSLSTGSGGSGVGNSRHKQRRT